MKRWARHGSLFKYIHMRVFPPIFSLYRDDRLLTDECPNVKTAPPFSLFFINSSAPREKQLCWNIWSGETIYPEHPRSNTRFSRVHFFPKFPNVKMAPLFFSLFINSSMWSRQSHLVRNNYITPTSVTSSTGGRNLGRTMVKIEEDT